MFNGNMKMLQIPVSTRFLNANRHPLRLKTRYRAGSLEATRAAFGAFAMIASIRSRSRL